MHKAFCDTGCMYRLCPFMLLSRAPGRRLGQGALAAPPGQCPGVGIRHRGLRGESLLESLTPARSPWTSLCHCHCCHPLNRSQWSALFSCLLGAAITFTLANLWCVAAAKETGRAVGTKLCAQHPLLCLPWAAMLSLALQWYLGRAPLLSLVWTTRPSSHHDSCDTRLLLIELPNSLYSKWCKAEVLRGSWIT